MRRLVLSLLLSVSPAVLMSAAAQDATPPAAPPPSPRSVPQLDATTVTATREDRPVIDVPASVTIIDGGELERREVHTIRDAVRYEPGVSVGNQPGRAGATSYNIRGIGENRVRVMIDGVRVPDFPGSNIGAGTYNRDFVDLDILRRIEIVRGPASALYGSDAIGGVVAYVTRDPGEYLTQVGRDWYIGGRFGYDSADQSFGQTAIGAARVGAFELLTMYSHRGGGWAQPNGPRPGTITNPQDYERHNVLAKLVWSPTTVASSQRASVINLHSVPRRRPRRSCFAATAACMAAHCQALRHCLHLAA
jgi:hemoglobin/transferrin/lactoferrin receptor protein